MFQKSDSEQWPVLNIIYIYISSNGLYGSIVTDLRYLYQEKSFIYTSYESQYEYPHDILRVRST